MSAKQIEIPVHDASGKEVSRVPLDLAVFDGCRRRRLSKDAVVMYHANKRVGTHDSKTRSEVAGSMRKPWRQKGTGRARAGTRKSPLWRGGGVTFGPHPRDHGLQMNKKQRRRAMLTAVYGKFLDGDVRLVDAIAVDAPKTRTVAALLDSLEIGGTCLIGLAGYDRNVVLSVRNLPGVEVSPVAEFNAFDVLRARTLLLTREALEALQELSSPQNQNPGFEQVEDD